MSVLQFILAVGIVVIAYFYFMPVELIMPETETVPDQMPNQIPKTKIIPILKHSENNTNISGLGNALNITKSFNVSISFNGYNGTKSKIAVELPKHAISEMPEISCNKSTYIGMPVFGENINVYFFECNCPYLEKAELSFNNHSKTFFILEEGNGWNLKCDNKAI